MNIYIAAPLASNSRPSVVKALRSMGHTVHVRVLPWVEADNASERGALELCDALVMVAPAREDSFLELGYVLGRGKPAVVVNFGQDARAEHPLFSDVTVIASMADLFAAFTMPTGLQLREQAEVQGRDARDFR